MKVAIGTGGLPVFSLIDIPAFAINAHSWVAKYFDHIGGLIHLINIHLIL